jgi:AcrR family transcriptional regulator
MADKKLHHHGDLRAALVRAGTEILEEEGLERFSLRKVAARAGVSHAAPAHHFEGKSALLTAIAAVAYARFTEFLREGRRAADPDPQAQLAGLCQGYLDFAEAHQAQFQLIFSTSVKENPSDELRETSMQAFDLLVETCDLFEPSPDHPMANALMIWALVHGFATLREYNALMSRQTGITVPIEHILPKLTPKP